MVCACRFIFAEKREMNDKQAKGQAGEQLAREYLQTNGYAILEANWKWGHLEVDIIAMKENTIVFVEVNMAFTVGIICGSAGGTTSVDTIFQ